MSPSQDFDIFISTAPGLEAALADEVRAHRFKAVRIAPGGVSVRGGWPDVWRANLKLRGAARVTAALGSFRAEHLSQLDKRARKFPWGDVLRADVPFRVEASCRASRIYHSGAAVERVTHAIAEELGAPHSEEAVVCVRVRIEKDVVNLAVDTSGELLHRRGFKQAVNIAPMRESMAALFLRLCGYRGTETVFDPMCGSGTFVIEAAEIAAHLDPGRARAFAFEQLATFNAAAWDALRANGPAPDRRLAQTPNQPSQQPTTPATDLTSDAPPLRFFGQDRDAGAVRMSRENAARAGVGNITVFEEGDVAEARPPEGAPGLVIVNPPYGDRVSDKARVAAIYRAFGRAMTARFAGWRVGLLTTDGNLAQATGLPFKPPGRPVSHGGLRVTLYLTDPLT